MRVLIDTNILADVLLGRDPYYDIAYNMFPRLFPSVKKVAIFPMPLTLPDVRNPHLNSPKIIQINKYSFSSYPRFTLLKLIYFGGGANVKPYSQLFSCNNRKKVKKG